MHQAKSELSRLVRDVLAGKRVRIARRGRPVVELHQIKEDSTLRVPGLLKGKIRISDDFYDLSEEELTRITPDQQIHTYNVPVLRPDC